jgi:hypothetical protein
VEGWRSSLAVRFSGVQAPRQKRLTIRWIA